jgi:microcystin-dependent protein
MSSPYVGEIRMFGGNFPPVGWMFCEGQLLPISEYEVLFDLIGTTYGGDGQSTFALPDLRGRAPLHSAPGFLIGQTAGQEVVTLTVSQIPAHSHAERANVNAGDAFGPGGMVPAESKAGLPQYAVTGADSMHAQAIATAGGSQPHENRMPYLAISYIISLFGIFPSRT